MGKEWEDEERWTISTKGTGSWALTLSKQIHPHNIERRLFVLTLCWSPDGTHFYKIWTLLAFQGKKNEKEKMGSKIHRHFH